MIKLLFMLVSAFALGQVNVVYGSYGGAVVNVVSVYDGDTFKVNVDGWPDVVGRNISVRVAGIDTPEMRGKCEYEKQLAREAKQFAADRLMGAEMVRLVNIKRGKYFRLVAVVYVDGVSLGEALIKQGLAVRYDGGTRVGWC